MKSLWLAAFLCCASALDSLDLVDGIGRPVHLDQSPRAVVSVTLMTDEFLAALVPPERIRAFSRSVDDPVLSNATEAAQLVRGRAWLHLETLVSLNPDLILAADWSDAGDLDFLRNRGFTVYTVATPRSWQEVKRAIAGLGKVLFQPEAAQALVSRLEAQEASLASVRAKVGRPVTVMEYTAWGTSMGNGTLWNEILALAGVRNASAPLVTDSYGYAPISRELLVRLDPDWLVLPTPAALSFYDQPQFMKTLQNDPLYRGLNAVKNGRVLFLSEAVKTSTSHAILEAAFLIQHAAYPNLR